MEEKAKTTNLRVKEFQGKPATTGVNIVAGMAGKLKPGMICAVSEKVADELADCDFVEGTRKAATHKLVDNEIVAV